MELDIQHCLARKNVTPFTAELDISLFCKNQSLFL